MQSQLLTGNRVRRNSVRSGAVSPPSCGKWRFHRQPPSSLAAHRAGLRLRAGPGRPLAPLR